MNVTELPLCKRSNDGTEKECDRQEKKKETGEVKKYQEEKKNEEE